MPPTGRKQTEQSQKFIDKAKELGADEDEKAFEEKLKRMTQRRSERKSDETK